MAPAEIEAAGHAHRKSEKRPELVIIKIGGAAITNKAETDITKHEVNREALTKIAFALTKAKHKNPDLRILLVHGAGSFAHGIAKAHFLTEPLSDEPGKRRIQLEGVSKIALNMHSLNNQVARMLSLADDSQNMASEVKGFSGIGAMPHHSPTSGSLEDKRIIEYDTAKIKTYLDIGFTVVTHADMMLDKKRGFSILSGDTLVPHLVRALEKDYAIRTLYATDVDGVYDKNPFNKDGTRDMTATLKPEIGHDDYRGIDFSGGKGTDVTGGMDEKVKKILDSGMDARIVSAYDVEQLISALLGSEKIGTLVRGKR